MVQAMETERAGTGFGAFGGLIRALTERVRRQAAAAQERRKLAREFAALSDNQLDRVLSDVGVARADLKTFLARAPYSRDLLGRMLARLGIKSEILRGGRALMRDIERQCAMCADQGRCHRWLADGGNEQGYRAFCPNAEIFDRLVGGSVAKGATK